MKLLLLAFLLLTLTGCDKTIHEARTPPTQVNGLR
jgi:hypothetical protein